MPLYGVLGRLPPYTCPVTSATARSGASAGHVLSLRRATFDCQRSKRSTLRKTCSSSGCVFMAGNTTRNIQVQSSTISPAKKNRELSRLPVILWTRTPVRRVLVHRRQGRCHIEHRSHNYTSSIGHTASLVDVKICGRILRVGSR